jgi:phosphatidylglycerophosphate synthase
MMMSEGAGELNSAVGAAPAVLPRSTRVAPSTAIPIILTATKLEAKGARMRVGGLRVIDRAIRLLARLRDGHVVIASDGSVPVPRRLPPNMERREINGNVTDGIERLRAELGPEAIVVGADNVWLQPARFDRGIRVVDAASRRAAAESVFHDAQPETVGIVDRLLNRKIALRLTQLLLVHLPAAPSLLTLIAGFVGVYGALMVAVGTPASVFTGFLTLEGFAILDGCAGELARVRLHQTALGAWLDTVVGDFVNVLMILAVGFALWRHGGTYLDMKMALAAAAMTLFYVVVSYRELMRQGEGDVMKLRWWFAYGQKLKDVSGAGSSSIRGMMLLGRRDFVIVLSLGLAYFDQLPIVLLYMMIIAIVRAAGALGQLLTSDWRIRPPA